MNKTSQERVKRNKTLDRFCGTKMTYEPVESFYFDAMLYNDQEKFIGIAKIFSKPGNFGNSPIVEISKEDLDMLYELGLFMRKVPAVVVKWRNKITYFRLEHTEFEIIEKTLRDKIVKLYLIPITEFKICS